MLCAYMDGKVYVVFNRNCFPNERPFTVRRPTGSHVVTYTAKLIVSKKWREIDTLVQFPMTLGDHEGHSAKAGLIKCNSTNICATFSTVLTGG